MKLLQLLFILCTLLLTDYQETFGQYEKDESPLLILGARYHKGFIIQHTKKLKDEVTQSNPWGLEADINWHLRKEKTWNYCYCYPRTGFAIRYTNFDFPDILGNAFSVYPFIEPYIHAEKELSLAIRFGIGPAYMTKIYDEINNPDNLFFSSRISFIALLNLSLNYAINDQIGLRLALNYNHISNSGISEPNLGINFPSINLGIEYSFKKADFPSLNKNPNLVFQKKKNRFDFITSISAKPATSGTKQNKYPVYGTSFNYGRALGRIFGLSGGIEWVNDQSLKEKFILDSVFHSGDSYPDHNRLGALLGIEWLFGKFIFYQQLGYYLYADYKEFGSFYQRYGLSYKLTKHLYVGINIKAHAQDADYMDIRLGFFL
jgi:hypothetical protein